MKGRHTNLPSPFLMYTKEEHKIIATFKSLGINITRCRIAVLKMFNLHKEALPTSYINKFFSGTFDRISVYRALKLFIRKGILLRIPNTEGEIRYLLIQNNNSNYAISKTQVAYFVCTCCDQMKMLDEPVFQQFKLPDNIKANQCYFLIEGICKSCDG